MANASDTDQPTPLPLAGAEGVIYIVDISGYVFRAFYALPPLTSEKGEPTGALYGVTSMLLKLVREQQPHMLAVVMDGKGQSFRKQLYDSYKANRPNAPDDLKQQMGRVREVADAYAIPCYEQDGVEADDLIASLTKIARARGHQVVLVSADKDLLQLVGDGVCMLDTMKMKTFGPRETREKLGVSPGQVRDYLALVGDSSDNIPGVPGIGPKTACELLTEHRTLDGIYAALPSLTKKAVKTKLETHRELAYLSRDLVTLKDDFVLPFDEAALRYGGWDEAKLRVFLKALAFSRLLDQLSPEAPVVASVPTSASTSSAPELPPLRVLSGGSELPELAETLRAAGRFTVYCAAENDEPIAGELVGIALGWEHDDSCEGAYLPIGHAVLGAPQVPLADIQGVLGPLFADAGVPKLASSKKREIIALARAGMTLAGVTVDTMLASYLIDPDLRGHGIRELALRRYALALPTVAELTGKGKAKRKLAELMVEELSPLVTPEVLLVAPLEKLLAKDVAEAKVGAVLRDIELPLAEVLASMEQRGVQVSAARLAELSVEVDR